MAEESRIAFEDAPAAVNIGAKPFIIPLGTKRVLLPSQHAKPFAANPQLLLVPDWEEFGEQLKIVDNGLPLTPRGLGVHYASAKSNPDTEFSLMANRVKSFKDVWPKSLSQQPCDMAQVGFFYTGEGDRAICFCCNLGLEGWAPDDDPFSLHCKWNPCCRYLPFSKGPRAFDRFMALKIVEKYVPSSQTRRGADLLCKKCRSNVVNKVNLPCGHMTCCNTCVASFCTDCAQDDGNCILAEIQLKGFPP